MQHFVKEQAFTLLQENEADLSKHLEKIKMLDVSSLEILIMEVFGSVFADMQYVGVILQKIQEAGFPEKTISQNLITVTFPDLVKDQFEKSKERYFSILQQGTTGKLQYVGEGADEIEPLANLLFETGALKLHKSLNNFCIMLKITLESSDFSPKIIALAKKIQKTREARASDAIATVAVTSLSSDSTIRAKSAPANSTQSAQNTPPPLARACSTPTGGAVTDLISRIKKTLSISDEPPTPEEEQRAEEYARIERYYKMFTISRDVMAKIAQTYQEMQKRIKKPQHH